MNINDNTFELTARQITIKAILSLIAANPYSIFNDVSDRYCVM